MGHSIDKLDVTGPNGKVDVKKLQEHIPDIGQFPEDVQSSLVGIIESGAKVYTTTVTAVHSERDKAKAGKVLETRDGMIKTEDTVAIVADWQGGSTNGAMVFLKDPTGKYGLDFHNEGFNVVGKGPEKLSGNKFFFTETGVMNYPASRNSTIGLVQSVRSDSPKGPDIDLTKVSRFRDDVPNEPAILLLAPAGSNIKIGENTYGVQVLVDGKAEHYNQTSITGTSANFKEAVVTARENSATIEVGNRTQATPVGNTSITLRGVKSDRLTPNDEPAEHARAHVLIPAAAGAPPAIVRVTTDDGKMRPADQLQASLRSAARNAEPAQGSRSPDKAQNAR